MSNEPREAGQPGQPAPPPVPRELFCIHSYAGEAGPPCGWRGPAHEVRRGEAPGVRPCPRCGRPTLLEIPPPLPA